MAIPNFETIMLPLLEYAASGKIIPVMSAEDDIAKQFNLSDEERKLQKSSGNESLFANRLRWARLYLKRAGLVTDPKRAHYQITEKGLRVLHSPPLLINVKFLQKFPEFKQWQGKTLDTSQKIVLEKPVQRGRALPRIEFMIESGNRLLNIGIMTEFASGITNEFLQYNIPFEIHISSGSLELAVDIPLQIIPENFESLAFAAVTIMSLIKQFKRNIRVKRATPDFHKSLAISKHVLDSNLTFNGITSEERIGNKTLFHIKDSTDRTYKYLVHNDGHVEYSPIN